MTRVSPYIDSHATATRIVEPWENQAACRGADPELFHSPEGERSSSAERADREDAAKAYCRRCVVLDTCLLRALSEEEAPGSYGREGIRGGLTPDERNAQFGKPKPRPKGRVAS